MSTIYSCSSSPKVVSFSKYSEVTLIPKEDIYTSKKWYSPNDRDQFYQNLNEDIKRASRDIAQQSLHHRKYECVGIDVFLTEGLAKRLLETKRAHLHAVLSEQNRQREREAFVTWTSWLMYPRRRHGHEIGRGLLQQGTGYSICLIERLRDKHMVWLDGVEKIHFVTTMYNKSLHKILSYMVQISNFMWRENSFFWNICLFSLHLFGNPSLPRTFEG